MVRVRAKEVPTECDETTEEPRTHAGKVILDIVRTGWMTLHSSYLGLESEGSQAQENSQGNQPAPSCQSPVMEDGEV